MNKNAHILVFAVLLPAFLCVNPDCLYSKTQLENIGQVSFYMKNGRIMKSEVLKEYDDTIRILSRGEELVIRKDAIQFALDSSGSEVAIEIKAEQADSDTASSEIPDSDSADEQDDGSGTADASTDVPVDGKTRILIQTANGNIFEGVARRENRNYYYMLDIDGKKEHRIRKRDVVRVERADLPAAGGPGKRIDFFMKDKTTVRGVVLEDKPAVYVVDSDGKKVELQKKDITFALDEEGKDFEIKIDPFLLKKLQEEEKARKEEEARKKRQAEEARQRRNKAEQEAKKKQAEKEENYSAGLRFFGDNDFKSAISHFERALLVDPKFAEAYYRLAFSYYQIGEEELAWKNIEKARELGIKQADTLITIMQKDKERRAKKEQTKKMLVWAGSGVGGAVVLTAGFLLLFRKKEDSLEGIEIESDAEIKPMEVSGEDAKLLSGAFENTKTTERGYSDEPEAVRVQAEEPPVQEKPASIYASGEQQFNPEKAEKVYLKANELISRGNLMEAKSEYENAIKFNPRLDVAYMGLGYVLLSQGKIKESVVQYNKCLDINPNSAEAHYSLGIAYYNMGDISQARYEWKKALLIDPNLAQAKECLESVK